MVYVGCAGGKGRARRLDKGLCGKQILWMVMDRFSFQ